MSDLLGLSYEERNKVISQRTFVCPKRHRSFLDRFRIGATYHRPTPGTLHTRRVEWKEFRGVLIPTRAATCLDCGDPITNVTGNVWGLRYFDDLASEIAKWRADYP